MVSVHELISTDINRPARYLGNEQGAIHKPWSTAAVRWVLTYPEIYEVAVSNLGHIMLYSIINAQPRQLCDRAYLPAPDLTTRLRETQTPLFALESRRSLTDFDILGFSLSYELGATNILEMLDLAGVPLTWQERDRRSGAWSVADGHDPLIFAGGQTATSNPEPYADFLDFVALGDGEELLPEIGLIIEEGKAAGLTREELLLDLAQVPGVYVPRFYEMTESGAVKPNRPDVPARVLRRVATPMPAYSIGLVPYVETVHDRLTVEIRRGCTRGCRFCQPGMLTRPARDVAPDEVMDTIERGVKATGYNEFSLLSLSCSDYLALPAVGMEIKNRLRDENVSVSLPSQRVDRFDENIANVIGGLRQTGLTFAPEAGTQRMRDIINKGLTNEELLRGVKTAHEQGWDKVKLYFMIGLPGETDVDVLGIVETIRWLRQECRDMKRKRLDFNVTISNFTPKPHTPFQWHTVSTSEFLRKQELLKDEFRRLRGVKVNFTDVRISAMEDFVGRGDRRLAPVIRRAWQLGAGMDAWWESLDRAYDAWSTAIDEAGLSWKYRQVEAGEWNLIPVDTHPSTAFATDPTPNDPGLTEIPEAQASAADANVRYTAPLPWDHLDTGIDRTWLYEDLQRALEAATVPDCSFEGCSHCGVCGSDFGHNVVVPPPAIPEFQGHFTPNQDRVQRFRITYGKRGDMALIGHLDLMRLWDRAVRRAGLPVAFTGGYHPGPRISPANALPLGATSSGELVDIELTRELDVADVRDRLAAQLPADLPLVAVTEIDLSTPAATKQLTQAAYTLTLQVFESSPQAATSINVPTLKGSSESTHALRQPLAVDETTWHAWIDQVLAATDVPDERRTKSGKKRVINLRDRLISLDFVTTTPGTPTAPPQVQIQYVGTCYNDGNMLRPEDCVKLLERVLDQEFELVATHRDRLILTPSAQVDAVAIA